MVLALFTMIGVFTSVAAVTFSNPVQAQTPASKLKEVLAQTDARVETIEPAALEYFECVIASADLRVFGLATPSDIADAALSECAGKFSILRSIVEARVGAERLREVRENARRAVISRVLSAREAAAKPASSMVLAAGALFDCVFDGAEQLVGGPGSPIEIADAAVSGCLDKYEAFRIEALASPYAQTGEEAKRAAETFASETRTKIHQGVVETILKARQKK